SSVAGDLPIVAQNVSAGRRAGSPPRGRTDARADESHTPVGQTDQDAISPGRLRHPVLAKGARVRERLDLEVRRRASGGNAPEREAGRRESRDGKHGRRILGGSLCPCTGAAVGASGLSADGKFFREHYRVGSSVRERPGNPGTG